MDYRVPDTEPDPPAKILVQLGAGSALLLLVAPFFVWWYTSLGFGLALGGEPAPVLRDNVYGYENVVGKFLVGFGLLCLGVWGAYAQNPHRWMRVTIVRVLIYSYLAVCVGIITVMSVAITQRHGLLGLYEFHTIGTGVYLVLGASITQSSCLVWLLGERIIRATIMRRRAGS